MSEDTIRKLASIQRIISLDPIPNADRIEVATILGWHVVVKKGEFKVDDLCVYFEVDSVLPKKPWSEFLVDKNRPDKPIRLRTIKLRGQVSQGLAIPLEVIGLTQVGSGLEEGDDVTDILGVTKYEPPIPAQLAGQVKGSFPSFLIKTDTHRVQAHPNAIQELKDCEEVYVTMKYDGTSSTFYNRNNCMDVEGVSGNDFGVCSRNMDLKENDTNTYWKMARQYELANVLADTNLAIQAETYGQGIQGNRLGLPDVQIGVFDIFDIITHRYFDLDPLTDFCRSCNLPQVQVLYRGPMKWDSVDELIQFSETINYPNHTDEHDSPAEGIIVRPTVETYSYTLQGRLAIKAISPRFLLKYGH